VEERLAAIGLTLALDNQPREEIQLEKEEE
jgi:hypothetical protein